MSSEEAAAAEVGESSTTGSLDLRMSSLEENEAADVDANQDQEWECPSIPILSTRWGLGEGVDPATVFKPIPIPPHLMKEQPLGPPDPRRALRGRGRSAGLTVHSEIIDPGDLEPLHPDPAPVSLSISEQISRVPQANLVTHQKADYGQYLLPARDGAFGSPKTSPTKHKNRRSPAVPAPVTFRRSSNWSGVLDPKAGATAVDSALARAIPLPGQGGAGAGDAPPVAGAGRTYASSDDEDDCYLEACSDSSASSSGRPFSLRRWRPRPPPIASTEAFPPLPGSHSAVVAATAAAAARPSAAGRRPSDKPVYTQPPGRGSPRPQTAPEPVSDASATHPSSSEPAAAGGGGDGQPLRPGQVKVTGVTDENWGSVQELISEYGAITNWERHGDTGYLTLSPPSNADWVREVMGEGAPGDCGLPGVAFPLADDQEVD